VTPGRPRALLLLALSSSVCLAGALLRPPSPITVCSSSGRYCLLSDPKAGTRAYRVRPNGTRDPLWSIPGWHRFAFLADDGRHAVTGYDGPLLPLNFSPDVPVFRFWRDGSSVRIVSLSSLVRDLGKLKRTASHYTWGNFVGFNAAGRFVVATVERPSVAFDVETGREASP
jgi:hypothetical protein